MSKVDKPDQEKEILLKKKKRLFVLGISCMFILFLLIVAKIYFFVASAVDSVFFTFDEIDNISKYLTIPLIVFLILLIVLASKASSVNLILFNIDKLQKERNHPNEHTNFMTDKQHLSYMRESEKLLKDVQSNSSSEKKLSPLDKLAGLFLMDKLFGGGLFGKKK